MKNILQFIYIKSILITFLFIISMFYEQAFGQRFALLFSSYCLIIVMSFLTYKWQKNEIRLMLLILIEIFMIMIMEMETKYVINYYFHFFYMLIIIEGAYFLKEKRGIVIGITAILTSLFKYMYILTLNPNYSNISEMFFAEIALVLVLIIVYIFNKYDEAKRKGEEQIKVLARFEERKRVARDLHDTLGHQLTSLIMQLEMLDYQINANNEQQKNMMIESKVTAREALKELRMVVDALHQSQNDIDFIPEITELVAKFQKRTGIDIEFNIPQIIPKLTPVSKYALYHVVEEALTNAIKHGNASSIKISMSTVEKKLIFQILNNGVSNDKFIKGNGLKGMEERIHNINGHIDFDGNEGFKITGDIPFKGEIND
ncbi:sensor histidine kinase [Vallitalea okinawensis]|uniref:sensor histidine kinase n=1 Tax=Vallitalea okinawensis TaxID=2078660 RepID=UPI0013001BFF|nr:sensor histidine kinase [Vallitalea okinawensis]